jgi:hypothetical protein
MVSSAIWNLEEICTSECFENVFFFEKFTNVCFSNWTRSHITYYKEIKQKQIPLTCMHETHAK